MSFINDLMCIIMEHATAGIYDVTFMIEKDGVLVGEKKTRRLMTFKQARELVK